MLLGILLGLAAATFQSLSYLATRHYVQRRPARANLQLLVLAHLWMGIFSVFQLLFVWPNVPIPWSALAVPLITTTLFNFAGQIFLAIALNHAEASRVSPLMTSKLILTATFAATLGQPVGAATLGITPLQFFAVGLCLLAGLSINFSGGRMKFIAALAIAASASSFAISDFFINLTIKALIVPGIDHTRASLLTESFSYLLTAILLVPLLKPLGSRVKKDWAAALPFAVTWFVAMIFLFNAFSTVGLLLASILQCTRGFITILLAAALMYRGHTHIEPQQSRGIILRRLAAGLLMFLGITLYVIRDPSHITLHRTQGASTSESAAKSAALRVKLYPLIPAPPIHYPANTNSRHLGAPMAKTFSDLTEQEILALAISLEEEDGRTYADIADALTGAYPSSAEVFRNMTIEEDGHRKRLYEIYRNRFGDTLPQIHRGDVKGFVSRTPIWLVKNLGLERVRKQAASMEEETLAFYQQAAARTTDINTRELLLKLATEEQVHLRAAEKLEEEHLPADARAVESDAQRKLFLLEIIQPGLVGLMDGSVSTLAPSSPPPLLLGITGTPSASDLPRRLEPASPWASRKRLRTMANFPVAVGLLHGESSAAS